MARITCLHGHDIELLPEQFGQRIACPSCQLLMVVSPPRPGEPITPKYEVLCENNHVLRVKSRYLGTSIRCPQCQALALVTTDRLQKHQVATTAPVVPKVLPPPPVRNIPPATMKAPPVAAPLPVDIPVAQVDDAFTPGRVPRTLEDDEEQDDREEGALTKAERRNLKLTDQGLDYFTYAVVGYCGIQMVATVLGFFIVLLLQGISSLDGLRTVGTISDVINWIVFGLMVLNSLLFIAGMVLTLFTPWITVATIWFVMSFVAAAGFFGWQIYNMTQWGANRSMLATYLNGTLVQILYETLFLLIWLFVMFGLWQLGRFARKPVTRQRVILLTLLGVGCWAVLTFLPYIIGWFSPASSITATRTSLTIISGEVGTSRAGMWVMLIFTVLLKLGFGALMIFQHMSVVSEVQAIMHRRK